LPPPPPPVDCRAILKLWDPHLLMENIQFLKMPFFVEAGKVGFVVMLTF
jgi:hypothetical protein